MLQSHSDSNVLQIYSVYALLSTQQNPDCALAEWCKMQQTNDPEKTQNIHQEYHLQYSYQQNEAFCLPHPLQIYQTQKY
jgi:hypothetical protein